MCALLDGLGELDAARANAEAALALYREAGDDEGIGYSLNGLGLTACHSGDFARGLPLLEEAVSHFRKAGDERGVAYAMGNLGYFSLAKKDHIAASAYLDEALPAFRRIGDVAGQAWVVENLALVALAQDRLMMQLRCSESLFPSAESGRCKMTSSPSD
jgi:tetratricopeptide (TPR) repeat protein